MANDKRMGAWLTRCSRQLVPSPSPYVVVGLLIFIPISVAPYSIIPSVLNWRFCGVLSNYHFGPREAGKSLINSSSRDAFLEHVSSICWPYSWRRHRFVFRAFFLPIYIVLLPHFLHFILADYWERQRERDRRLLLRRLSFCHYIFCYLIFRQSLGLSSKCLLTVSFHFLTFLFVVK